jgi:small subunit ribosomal protein S16
MLSIRLQRVGRKNEPAFRFVLTDSKNSTKSGKFLEILGSHDPRNKKATIMNVERMKELIAQGAKPSDTITNMLIEKKVITGKKINVLPKKSPIKKEGADAPATEAAPAAAPAEAPQA